MRRCLLILLIAMLPLQAVWAAAGVCICLSEGRPVASTAATMEHLETLAQGSDSADLSTAGEACSPHCGACHLACAQLLQPTLLAPGSAPGDRPVPQDLAPPENHIPDGLDRPDWRQLA